MAGRQCTHCGATAEGLVCSYCGAVAGELRDMEKQRLALEEYHSLLRTGDKSTWVKILNAGFLPDYGKLLIDAGLTCISLINTNEVSGTLSTAAVQRLEAIILKLQILPKSPESEGAVSMFQKRIIEYRTSTKKDTIYGFIAIGIFILLVVLSLIYFFS